MSFINEVKEEVEIAIRVIKDIKHMVRMTS